MRRNHTKTESGSELVALVESRYDAAAPKRQKADDDMRKLAEAMGDTEDLDIPAETLAGSGTDAPAKPVYRWEIPLDSNPGYLLPIEITDAASIEHARNAALSITLGATEIEEGRNLTAMEQAWVKATEPQVVRDTEAISLDYDAALRENARLCAENALYAGVKRILVEHGIDPLNPQAWADARMADAAECAKSAIDAQDARHQRLAAKLVKLRAELESAIDETGFAPAKPQPVAEPDYSALTVVVRDASEAERYPRLAGANFIVHDPGDPLTEEEAAGLEMIARDDAGFIDQYLRGFPTPLEEIQLRAIRGRLRALFGG